MGSKWPSVQLGKVASVRSGFAFKSAVMGDVGLPIIKIKNVIPPTVDIADCERVPEDIITEIPGIDRFELKEGDILIAMTGATVGKVGRFPHADERYFLNQRVGKVYLTEPSVADYRYIYYILSQDTYVRQMFGIADGSAQANISGSQIESMEVPFPPLPEQRAIACILGSLDDKIELNRRMNKTLEDMARAIFKSWFVDFDPVHAKAAVRCEHPDWSNAQVSRAACPNLKPEIAELFPDSFEDSELGEIPQGWRVGCVSDLAEVTSGKRPEVRFPHPSSEASVPLWGGNGPMAFVSKTLINEPILLTGRVGTLGAVFRITGPCWPSDNTLILRANRQSDYEYLFLQLREIDFVSLNRGSTQPLLTQTDLKLQRLVLPLPTILERFSCVVASLYKRIDETERESRSLAALRDALLPKLISGELPIKDAERIAERCLV